MAFKHFETENLRPDGKSYCNSEKPSLMVGVLKTKRTLSKDRQDKETVKKRLPQINSGKLPVTASAGELLWEQHNAQNLPSGELDMSDPSYRETFKMIKELSKLSEPE